MPITNKALDLPLSTEKEGEGEEKRGGGKKRRRSRDGWRGQEE